MHKPQGWLLCPLKACCEIVQGQSPSGDTYNSIGKGLPFFQGKAEFGDLYPKVVKWCTQPTKVAEPDDVLISIRAPVGPTNLCRETSCIGRGLAAIRPLGKISSKYVLYGLRSTAQALVSKGSGSTFAAISGNDLREHIIPLAPLAEQQRIVEEIEKHFSRLDSSVAGLKRVRANLERYRASVLKAASEGRLVPSEAELARAEGREYEPAEKLLSRILKERQARWEEEQLVLMKKQGREPKNDKWKAKYQEPIKLDTEKLGLLPEGWCYASLDQLTHFITSGSRGWAAHYSETGHIFIRSQDINTDRLVLHSVARVSVPDGAEGRRTRVAQHDILVTITGANVTKAARVIQDPGEAYVSQHVALIRPVLGDTTPYVYIWVISPAHGRGRLEKAAYGAGKPGLNLDNLRELPIALPPADEQKRIAAEVERRLSVADEAEAVVETNLRRAEQLRQAILRRAFEGRLVAQDTTDEPAALLLERIKAERAVATTAPTKGSRRGQGQPGFKWPQGEGAAPTGAQPGWVKGRVEREPGSNGCQPTTHNR